MITVLGILSIAIGFACFAGAFLTVMRKGKPVVAIAFGIAALIFLTVIPVTLAVFFASNTGS